MSLLYLVGAIGVLALRIMTISLVRDRSNL